MIPEWLEKEVAEYDMPLVEAPRTVLDIGANIGAFTKRARAMWPKAHITAYEPIFENVNQWMENFGQEDAQNIRLRNYSVVDTSSVGEMSMYRGDCHTTHSFQKTGRQLDSQVRVKCWPAKKVDSAEFVKIDTEGCELEIITNLDLSETKAIALEYHSKEDGEEISLFLQGQGFEQFAHLRHGENHGVLKYARPGAVIKKRKLFLGLPIYGAVDAGFFCAMMKLVMEMGRDLKCDIMLYPNMGDSAVGRARNTIAAAFLKSDATDLLMIDSDLVFSVEQINRIMSHPEELVGGVYFKKNDSEIGMVCNALETPVPCRADGLQQVRYVGTGFMRISRSVFERMIEKFGDEMWYVTDHSKEKEYDFFHMGQYQYADKTRRYLSEDWWFCQKWLDLGGKVWLDRRIILEHRGITGFPTKAQREVAIKHCPDAIPEELV
jgi:FkbM family methyltransferase